MKIQSLRVFYGHENCSGLCVWSVSFIILSVKTGNIVSDFLSLSRCFNQKRKMIFDKFYRVMYDKRQYYLYNIRVAAGTFHVNY